MKFADIDINIQNFNKIGLRISGGADSAILLQLLCETIRAERIPGESYIQPLTVNMDVKPWNPVHVKKVLEFTRNKYSDIDIRPLIEVPCTKETYVTSQAWVEKTEEYKGWFEIIFGGVTANPLESDVDWGWDPIENRSIWEKRDRARDQDADKTNEFYFQQGKTRHFTWKSYPFTYHDKKKIAELYDLLNVRNTLFPLTRSCEGGPSSTDNFQKQCGKCWWCKERIYGFGSLD
jgi:7-cyano-7-deazaguanine synthase in queuosine biosynthesis